MSPQCGLSVRSIAERQDRVAMMASRICGSVRWSSEVCIGLFGICMVLEAVSNVCGMKFRGETR